jgi:hypothetical protein
VTCGQTAGRPGILAAPGSGSLTIAADYWNTEFRNPQTTDPTIPIGESGSAPVVAYAVAPSAIRAPTLSAAIFTVRLIMTVSCGGL